MSDLPKQATRSVTESTTSIAEAQEHANVKSPELVTTNSAESYDATAATATASRETLALGFSDGLAGWDITIVGGSDVGRGTVVEGSAILTEGDSFVTGLERFFEVPNVNPILQFTYTDLQFDTSDRDSVNDAFEASLVDADGFPIVHTIGGDRGAFFNITEGESPVLGSETQLMAGPINVVTVDLSDVPAGTQGNLRFQLVNNDSDTQTSVRILDVLLPGTIDDMPQVTAVLANDTAPVGEGTEPFENDGLTNDPRVIGQATDDRGVIMLEASVDGGPFVDVTDLMAGDYYEFDPGNLPLGPHQIVMRVTDTGGQTSQTTADIVVNQAPVANAGTSRTASEGDEVFFDASASFDVDGPIFDYAWTFADGSMTSGVTTSRIYPQNGRFPVMLAVTDTAGSVANDSIEVVVENEPPTILSAAHLVGTVGEPVDLVGTFSDPGVDDTHVAVIYWGDGSSSDGVVTETNGQGSVSASHVYSAPGSYSVRLEVEDDDGGRAQQDLSAQIDVNTSNSKVYRVPGEPGELMRVTFEWTERDAAFDNELGIYQVANLEGEVGGKLPSDPEYVLQALTDPTQQVIFSSGETIGERSELVFSAGTLLAFYLVQDGSTEDYLANRDGSDEDGYGHHDEDDHDDDEEEDGDDKDDREKTAFDVWTLFASSNSDGLDHFQCAALDDGLIQFSVEDQTGGGDQDFNDMVFTVSAAPAGPDPHAKFYVVDDQDKETYLYDANGASIGSRELAWHNNQPQGATSNVTGDTLWVVDNSKHVFVYDAEGDQRGHWQADEARNPEGIATDGEDIWIVSKSSRRVYRYEDATGWLSGSHDSSDDFRLNFRNKYPTGLATDGQTIWVTDGLRDQVFVYDVDGAYLGKWDLDSDNSDAAGITNDPGGGSDLWVVDNRDDAVYQYAGATAHRSGSHDASDVFDLARNNRRPEGIADPPRVTVSTPTDGGQLPTGSDVLISGVASTDTAGATVSQVMLNSVAVPTVDLAGNFFAERSLVPGRNVFEISVVDSVGDTATTVVSVDASGLRQSNDLSALFDVSASLSGDYGITSYSAQTQELLVDLAIRHDGDYSVEGSLLVGITNLSNPSVRVRGFDGRNPEGIPYFDYSDTFTDGRLNPGESSGDRQVRFYNPNGVQFDYDLVFLGGLNQSPRIVSAPRIEAIAGQTYRYDVDATDADQDVLTYSLQSRTGGMSIDSETGMITWNPSPTQLGNLDVTILVSDGKGGTATQQFVLEVIDAPPNRPPVITSAPIVSASVSDSTAYSYEVAAFDPDGDPLDYSLVTGPTGMQLDSSLGVLSWSPSTQDVGSREVTLVVDDGRGGSVEQSFIVQVSNPNNSAPVIVSDPPTLARINPNQTNPPLGNVAPQAIDLQLGDGDSVVRPVSLTLPEDDSGGGSADILFVVDESGSMEGEQAWLRETVSLLEAELNAKGLTDNRYGLVGYGHRGSGNVDQGFPHIVYADNYIVAEAGTSSYPGYVFDSTELLSTGITLADLNEDGRLDILTGGVYPTATGIFSLDVYLNDGLNLGEPIRIIADREGTVNVDVDDLNGDGHIDVVALGAREAFVFLGDGTGQLTKAQSFRLFDGYTLSGTFSATGDVNADGILDIVTVLPGAYSGLPTDQINAFLGVGDGTFSTATISNFAVDGSVMSISVADINCDGCDDLITLVGAGDNPVRIALGQADGTFLSPTVAIENAEAYADTQSSVIVVDANSDGFMEIVYTGSRQGYIDEPVVAVLTANADGTYAETLYETKWQRGGRLTFGDADGDGVKDLGVSRRYAAILRGLGDGSFEQPEYYYPGRFQNGMVFADYNNDDIVDIVATEKGFSGMYPGVPKGGPRVLLGNGDGTFGVTWGTAEQLETTARNLIADGVTEDGYLGMYQSLTEFVLRDRAARHVILITDEDRDVVGGTDVPANAAEMVAFLLENEVQLTTIVKGAIQDANGDAVLGLDANGTAYADDGSGGYVASAGGQFVAGEGTTEADYVDVALATEGTVWDLNRLREGGDSAASFSQAFVDITTTVISRDVPIDVIPTNSQVQFENLTGVIDGVGPNETAAFDVQFTGDGEAYGFDLNFVRGGTGNVIGSIPVTINAGPDTRLVHYQVDARDADGDTLSYQLTQGPGGATIDSTSGLLSFEASEVGSFPFAVQVDDGRGGVAVQEFILEVTAGGDNQPPTITSTPPTSATVDETFQYNVAATDSDGDELLYLLQEFPDGMTIDSTTGVISWTPTADLVGIHPVQLAVLDGQGGQADQNFSVTVAPTADNDKPVFASTPDSAAEVARQYSYSPVVFDANGDSLAFDLPLKPVGMVINPDSGVLGWIPTQNQIGTHSVALRVRDARGAIALQTFLVDVVAANVDPVITSTPPRGPAAANLPYEYPVRAQDANNDPLTFRLQSGPADMTIDPASGVLAWTPSIADISSHSITIAVEDGRGGVAEQTFALDVAATTVNEDPIILSSSSTSVLLGDRYLYRLQVIDNNGDPITIQLDSPPSGMTLDGDSLIQWTPDETQLGLHNITIRASDGRGGEAVQTFGLRVAVAIANEPPVIVSNPPASSVVGTVYEYDTVAEDPDGDLVVWMLDTAPDGMSIGQDSGQIRWTPNAAQVGEHVVAVRALDPKGGGSAQTFSVVVRPVNTPPTIHSWPPTTAYVGEQYTYALESRDDDGDILAYEVVGPSTMTIDPVSGLLRWTPVSTDVGIQPVSVSVRDGMFEATQSFDLYVAAGVPNRAPTITSTPVFLSTINEPYEYPLIAADPEGAALTYNLLDGPAGMTIGGSDGRLQWTPGTLGQFDILVQAVDDLGASATQGYQLTVLPPNNAPEIVSAGLTMVTAEASYRYDVRVFEPDGEPIEFALITSPDGMAIDQFGRVSWLPEINDIGTHAVSLSVTDRAD